MDELETMARTPGAEAVEAVVSRVASNHYQTVREDKRRELAGLLAQTHPPELFLEAYAKRAKMSVLREFFLCWAHEVVVRHGSLDVEIPGPHRWDSLPFRRLPLESKLPEQLLSRHGPDPPEDSVHDAPPWTRQAVLLDPAEALKTAVSSWKNGPKECGIFLLDGEPWGVELLAQLPLSCWDKVTRVGFYDCRPEDALGELYAASYIGGQMGHPRYGGWARWEAWESLRALVGADSFEQAEKLAAHCRWGSFYPASPSSWDPITQWLGIIALRPDGSCAVLAACDSD